MTECYRCGQDGHTRSNCPQDMPLPGGPPPSPGGPHPEWCGTCDKRTRLIDHGTRMSRCDRCHALRFTELAQFRRCGGCGHRVCAWDPSPCDSHETLRRLTSR